MKRFAAILITAVIMVSSLSLTTAFASDVGITFSGETSVEPGKTYTYTYKMTYNDACEGTAQIYADGIFENVKGQASPSFQNYFVNTGGVVEGAITVSVKSSVKPGETGSIYIRGTYGFTLGADYKTADITCSPLQACVPLPEPTPAPSVAPTPSLVPVPQVTPAPEYTPAPSLEPTQPPVSGHTVQKDNKPPQPTTQSLMPSQTPSQTPEPSETITPGPSPSAYPAEWAQLGTQLDTLPKGGTLSITAPESRSIPYVILKALKAKQCTLELTLGDYSCIISGDSLNNLPEDSGTLNLDMSMLTDPILSDAADGFDIYQLHFGHNGDLPGRFMFRFEASKNNPGDEVYLYYYSDMSGMIEHKQTAVVDENGYVSFDIYSCSSYFVTGSPIGDSAALQTVMDESAIPLASPQGTASEWFIIIPILCVALVCGITFMRLRRIGPFKKRRE